jgi:hypothetical protein
MADYLLNDDDRALLIRMAQAVMRDQGQDNTGQRPRVDSYGEEYLTPEVYVVLIPPGGISAMTISGTSNPLPGMAFCNVYQLIQQSFLALALVGHFPVWNVSTTMIEQGTYTLGARAKWGSWYAVPMGGGSGGATVDTLRLTSSTPDANGRFAAKVQTVTVPPTPGGGIAATFADGTDCYYFDPDLSQVINLVREDAGTGGYFTARFYAISSGKPLYIRDDFNQRFTDVFTSTDYYGVKQVKLDSTGGFDNWLLSTSNGGATLDVQTNIRARDVFAAITYSGVKQINFDSPGSTINDWTISFSGGILTVANNGFSGSKQVCEGDGTLHTWLIENGHVKTAP